MGLGKTLIGLSVYEGANSEPATCQALRKTIIGRTTCRLTFMFRFDIIILYSK